MVTNLPNFPFPNDIYSTASNGIVVNKIMCSLFPIVCSDFVEHVDYLTLMWFYLSNLSIKFLFFIKNKTTWDIL